MGKNKFGKIVVIGSLVGSAAYLYKKYDSIKSMYHKVSAFTGKEYKYDEFDGEAIAAMFAGVQIDLSNAQFGEEEVYLDLYGFCSGIRVLLPKGVDVSFEGTNKLSGVTMDQDESVPKTKKLIINYRVTMSGLQVTDSVHQHDACCEEVEDVVEVAEDVVEDAKDVVEEAVEEAKDVAEDLKEKVEDGFASFETKKDEFFE
ncbi:MAG: hypothetical protein JW708_04900 [Vallitaleaceae bacterium]|nr:hypothetical protein [Vallitaleaceae bacterium]